MQAPQTVQHPATRAAPTLPFLLLISSGLMYTGVLRNREAGVQGSSSQRTRMQALEKHAAQHLGWQ